MVQQDAIVTLLLDQCKEHTELEIHEENERLLFTTQTRQTTLTSPILQASTLQILRLPMSCFVACATDVPDNTMFQ